MVATAKPMIIKKLRLIISLIDIQGGHIPNPENYVLFIPPKRNLAIMLPLESQVKETVIFYFLLMYCVYFCSLAGPPSD